MQVNSREEDIPYVNTLRNNLNVPTVTTSTKLKNNFIIMKPKTTASKVWVTDQNDSEKPLDASSRIDFSELRSDSFFRPQTEGLSPTKVLLDDSPESSPTLRLRLHAIEDEEIKSDRKPKEKNADMSMLFPEDVSNSQQEPTNSVTPAVPDTKQDEKRKKVLAFLQNKWVIFIITIFTFYALYADDVRLLATSKTADPTFSTLTIIVILTFFIEIVLHFYSKKVYRWSLFFFLDVISTISLIFDIPLVSEAIFYPE